MFIGARGPRPTIHLPLLPLCVCDRPTHILDGSSRTHCLKNMSASTVLGRGTPKKSRHHRHLAQNADKQRYNPAYLAAQAAAASHATPHHAHVCVVCRRPELSRYYGWLALSEAAVRRQSSPPLSLSLYLSLYIYLSLSLSLSLSYVVLLCVCVRCVVRAAKKSTRWHGPLLIYFK